MSLAEDNLQFVVLHAMADFVKKELGRLREGHTSTLIQQYKDTQGTAYKVSLPGDSAVVATVTLRVPKSELELADEDAFLKWAAANHPDVVELEQVPAVPEQVIPAQPAYERPFVNGKKFTEVQKHFTRGEDGEVVDTSTGVFVDGMRWSTPPDPSQFEVRYEGDGRDRVASAYRSGRLNEVVGGTSLGAITAGPVVERRLVVAPAIQEPPYDEDGQTCTLCLDQVATVSSVGYCDGCEARLEQESHAADEDAVSPARAALEEHFFGEVNLAEGDVDAPDYERPAPAADPDPWASPVPAGQPFDPGDW